MSRNTAFTEIWGKFLFTCWNTKMNIALSQEKPNACSWFYLKFRKGPCARFAIHSYVDMILLCLIQDLLWLGLIQFKFFSCQGLQLLS